MSNSEDVYPLTYSGSPYGDDSDGDDDRADYANQKGGGGYVLPGTGGYTSDTGGARTWSGDWEGQEDA